MNLLSLSRARLRRLVDLFTARRNQEQSKRPAQPRHVQLEVLRLEDRLTPSTFTPAQILTAYGVNAIPAFGGTLTANGAGQTIAIVDAYNDANIQSDLTTFDHDYGLAPPPSFRVVNQTGGSTLPGADPDGPGHWDVEESLDVEWAHAIAPGANLILVEANSNDRTGNPDLETAEAWAASSGASVISNSWGALEYAGEQGWDSTTYVNPQATGAPGVAFLFSAGDTGLVEYPSASPNVLSVGGTSLTLNANNSYQSETGWNDASNSAGGGGVSQYESRPAYQNVTVAGTAVSSVVGNSRGTPDVSLVADPNTGVYVLDTLYSPSPFDVGGTSASCPMWAGLVAIIDQGRAQVGLAPLNTSIESQSAPNLTSYQLQTDLYDLAANPTTYAADFHDITSGHNNNGNSAAIGYDLVTGLGSPLANTLVPDMVGYSSTSLAVNPPSTTAGGPIHLTATVTGKTATPTGTVDFKFGSIDLGTAPLIGDTATLNLATSPLTAGTDTITAYYLGDANYATSNGNQTVTVVAPPSIVAAFSPTTITLTGTSSLTFTITNPTANTVAETGVGFTVTLPAGLTVVNGSSGVGGGTLTLSGGNTITLSGASVATDGTLVFSVTVTGATAGGYTATTSTVSSTNGGTGNSASASLTVDAPPSITSANTTTFTVGSAGSFTFSTTGFPTASLSDGGFTLPSGVTFTNNGNGTATLAGTPSTLGAGPYVFTFTVTASNGVSPSATQSFTLTIDQAPAITSAANTTFTVGSAGSFTFSTTGFPAASLSDGGFTLPSGVTFTNNGNGTATLAGTPSNLGAGPYVFTFTVTASNGVSPNATQSFTLTIDQAPAITSANNSIFTVGVAGSFTVMATGFPAPTFSATGTLPGGILLSSAGLLSGTPAAGTGGTYNFTITASNGVGTSASESFTLTVDQAPAITSATNTIFTVGSAGSFTFSTTGFPAASLSDGGFTLPSGVTFTNNGDGTATLAGTPSNLGAGPYVFTFTVTASNGVSPNATQSFTLTIDQAPAITSANNSIFTVGVAGSFTVMATGFPAPTFSATGTLPGGILLSSAGLLSGTPAAGTGGTYNFTITASNGVGSSATQSFTLTIDQAPAITSATGITFTVGSAGSFTFSTTGFPAASLSDGGFTLPSGVTFTNNGDGTATLAGTPSTLGAGPYVFTFTVTASNGVSPSATQSFTLTIDQAPAITSAANTTFTAGVGGSFTIMATGFPAPTFSATGTLPGGILLSSAGLLSGTPAAGTGGTYNFTITASNGVGSSATQSFTLTIDQAPAITSATNTIFTVGSAGSFTFSTTGFPAARLSDGGFTLPSGVTFTNNGDGTATLAGTPSTLGAGPYVFTFTVTASNGIGSNATQSFTLTIDQAPAITTANNSIFTVGVAGSFTVMATGFPAPTFSATGTLPGGILLSSAGLLSGTPAAGTGGTYNFTITASNGVGSSATQSFTLTIDQAPAISSATGITFTVGSAGSFTFSTTGFPAARLSDGGFTLPSGVTFTNNGDGTATLAGTPSTLGAGPYVFTFTVTASNGVSPNATQSFTLTIDQAPAITSANNSIFTVGVAGSFTVMATGFPAPTFSATGTLPGGILLSSAGLLSGTPAAGTGGTYNFTITASNGVGSSATQSFTLTIDQAPAISSATGITFTVGSAGSFTFSTTGFPAASLSDGGFTLPSGVTFTNNGDGTATLAGTPSNLGAGPYVFNFTVTASNGVSPSATQNFTLTVDQGITSANTVTFPVGNSSSFTVAATGFPAPTFSESGALPSGVSFSTSTGVLSGTPATGTEGSYTLTITASNGVSPNATQSFTLIALGPTASVTATSTASQNTTVLTAFAVPFQVALKDSAGDAEDAGINVTFTVFSNSLGAGATFTGGVTTVTVTTNASGIATAPTLTANGTIGTFTVTASTADLSSPATFTLTNTPAGLPFTDNFSPSQATLTAANWQVLEGGFSQNGTQAVAGSAPNNFAEDKNASAADVSVSAQNVSVIGNGTVGLFARVSGPSGYLATLSNSATNGVVTIFALTPSFVTLVSVNVAKFTTPVNLTFDVVGISLRVFVNGTLEASILNTAVTGPGLVGLYGTPGETLGTFSAAAAVPALPFSDTFTPNQATLTAANWQVLQGGFSQNSGQAVASATANNFAVDANASATDVSVSAQNVSVLSGGTVGLLARLTSAGGYLATLSNAGSSGVVTLFEVTSTAYVPLTSVTVAKFTTPVTLTFEVVGNSLQVFVNGTLEASILNSAVTGAGLVGIYGTPGETLGTFSANAAAPALPFTDNFSPSQATLSATNWQVEQGGFSQNGTQAVASSAGLNIATYANASAADVSVSAQNVSVLSGGTAGLVARFTSATSYYLATLSNSGSNGVVAIFESTASGFQVLKSVTVAKFTSPVTLTFNVQGTSLQVLVNGTMQASVTNTDLTGPGLVGLWGTSNENFGTFNVSAL